MSAPRTPPSLSSNASDDGGARRSSCENCRVRKIKCNGRQPCSGCSRQALGCNYERVKQRERKHQSRIAGIRREQANAASEIPAARGSMDIPTVSSSSSGPPLVPSASPEVNPEWNLPYEPPIFHQGHGNFAPSLPPFSQTIPDFNFGLPQSTRPDPPLPSKQPQYNTSWPDELDDASVLPWLSDYFERINPITPVLSRIQVYEDMLLGRHRTDSDFGAMILAACAFAMIQSIYTEEAALLEQRTKIGRSLMQHTARMRASWDFGQAPTPETILTSFFLFGALFSDNQENAAWHQLRLAVDMSRQIQLDVPDVYPVRSKKDRDQRMRIYLTLAISERACALMRRQIIGLRGRPWSISLSAQQMSVFFEDPSLAFNDSQSQAEILGLFILASLFDGVDESIINCWDGWCRKTDGICDVLDRRELLQVTRRIMTTQNYSETPFLLNHAQKADILMTQLWILNRLWHLGVSHGLQQAASEHAILTREFPMALVCIAALFYCQLPTTAFEVHGMGMLEKLNDLSAGLTGVRESVGELATEAYLRDPSNTLRALAPCADLWRKCEIETTLLLTSSEDVVNTMQNALQKLRSGRHPYHQAASARS